ncbi:MAG: hypothetical protein CVV27_11220, partial [Candidatus Melainabacteria bacterium HGW-Melainabacteria-1]
MRKNVYYILVLLAFVGICFGLAQAKPDQNYLRRQQFTPLLEQVLTEVQTKYPQSQLMAGRIELPQELQQTFKTGLSNWQEKHPHKQWRRLNFAWRETGGESRLEARSGTEVFFATRARLHWVNALPPIVTITAALLTQNLLLSLFVGILFGSILAAGGNPLIGSLEVFSKHGWAAISDVFHLQILVFSAVLLGMVGIMNVSGGTRGIVAALQRYIRNRRSTKLMTALMGLLIFFDDYANCFVIGTTLRPVTDQHKISREKLAYL